MIIEKGKKYFILSGNGGKDYYIFNSCNYNDYVDNYCDEIGNVFATEKQVEDYWRWLKIKRQIEKFAYEYNKTHPYDVEKYFLSVKTESVEELFAIRLINHYKTIKFNDGNFYDFLKQIISEEDLVFYLLYQKPFIILEK